MRKISYDPLWKKLIDAKMTKTELAKACGVSRTTIAKM
ncbi:helix-turn-helix domain-containing protein [Candidatus Weimeria sp. HCP3S3_B5]